VQPDKQYEYDGKTVGHEKAKGDRSRHHCGNRQHTQRPLRGITEQSPNRLGYDRHNRSDGRQHANFRSRKPLGLQKARQEWIEGSKRKKEPQKQRVEPQVRPPPRHGGAPELLRLCQ
jgi:hypothetical protein